MPSQSTSEPFATTTEAFQKFVLAGCHSLIHFQEGGTISVVGDPLDQAALKFSGWKHNHTLGCYSRPETDADGNLDANSDSSSSSFGSQPARLWQICSFPFDPCRRLSSAILLLQREDSRLELWKVTKGSPDTMIDMIEKDDSNVYFSEAEFKNQTQELEIHGYRSIALGAENLAGNSSSSSIARELFPNGLSINAECIAQAKANGEALHRNVVDTPGLIFCGFCCFEASIRPSSKRVVKELLRGGLECIMLTGDSVDAALSVARKVGMYKHRKIAVLERSENPTTGEEAVIWRILTSKVTNDGSFKLLHHRTKTEKMTVSSVKKYIRYNEEGRCLLAANGRALELILFGHPDRAGTLIARNLDAVSIVARATPELKKQVIETLKHECGKKVMMCGESFVAAQMFCLSCLLNTVLFGGWIFFLSAVALCYITLIY